MQTTSFTFLIGRVGTDPVQKEVKEGKTVTTFTVATEDTWKDAKGEKQSRTEWHNIEMWGNENVVKYITKGANVSIKGSNRTDHWEKNAGGEVVKMQRTKIVVDEIGLLDSAKGKE